MLSEEHSSEHVWRRGEVGVWRVWRVWRTGHRIQEPRTRIVAVAILSCLPAFAHIHLLCFLLPHFRHRLGKLKLSWSLYQMRRWLWQWLLPSHGWLVAATQYPILESEYAGVQSTGTSTREGAAAALYRGVSLRSKNCHKKSSLRQESTHVRENPCYNTFRKLYCHIVLLYIFANGVFHSFIWTDMCPLRGYITLPWWK